VPAGDDQDQLVAGKPAELQVGTAAPSADQPEVGSSSFDLAKDVVGVRHGHSDLDAGVSFVEDGQGRREQVLAGNGTGGEDEFTHGFRGAPGHGGSGLGGQVGDPAGIFVEPAAGVGE
jgi:hypothetical protein